jgi:hypothetical protein
VCEFERACVCVSERERERERSTKPNSEALLAPVSLLWRREDRDVCFERTVRVGDEHLLGISADYKLCASCCFVPQCESAPTSALAFGQAVNKRDLKMQTNALSQYFFYDVL